METDGLIEKKEGHHLSTGRIRNFDKAGYTPDTLEDKIDEYFDSGEEDITITSYYQGKPYDNKLKIFTLPALCRYIGIESRQTYWRIMNDALNPYMLPLKKGYLRLQEFFEKQSMLMNNPAGPVFILKNLDYSDQTTINQIVQETPKPEIQATDKDTGKMVKVMFNQEVKTGT